MARDRRPFGSACASSCADGSLLSDNFYWHATDETELKALTKMPTVDVKIYFHYEGQGPGRALIGEAVNEGRAPALEVRLLLRDAETHKRVLPAYYSEDFFDLLPVNGALSGSRRSRPCRKGPPWPWTAGTWPNAPSRGLSHDTGARLG